MASRRVLGLTRSQNEPLVLYRDSRRRLGVSRPGTTPPAPSPGPEVDFSVPTNSMYVAVVSAFA